MEKEKLYTANDVAKYLGLNTDYVRKLARAKKIGSLKVGSMVRFTQEHVDGYIKESNK